MRKESDQQVTPSNKKTATKSIRSRRTVLLYFSLLMIFWSVALFIMAQVDYKQIDAQAESFAINKTRSLLEKDVTYYQWVGSQSDIYFVKTQQDAGNSNSDNVSSDAANQRIELMQFTPDALLGLSQNIWAKRTGSIIAIYTDASQAQEQSQLDALKLIFDGKARSISGLRKIGDKEYMSVMLPLEFSGEMEQGAKVTKVISLQYPMQEFFEEATKDKTVLAGKYLVVWLSGMVLLFLIMLRLFMNMREWDKQLSKNAQESDDLQDLQNRINLRTQDVIQLQKNLQSFMDQVPLSAYIKDKDSTFVAVNQKFADSLGCSKEKLIGSTGDGVLPPELADYFYQFEQIILNSGERVLTGDFEFAHNGLHFGVMFPVMGTYGQVTAISAVLPPLAYKDHYQPEGAQNSEPLSRAPVEQNIVHPTLQPQNEFVNNSEPVISAHNPYVEDLPQQAPLKDDQPVSRPVFEVPVSPEISSVVETPVKADSSWMNTSWQATDRMTKSDAEHSQVYSEPERNESVESAMSLHTEWETSKQSDSGVAGGNLFDTLQARNQINSSAGYASSYDNTAENYQSEARIVPEPEIVVLESQLPVASSQLVVPEPVVAPPEVATVAPIPRSSVALNILVVDDDEDEARVLAEGLEKLGHALTVANSASSGLDLIKYNHFDAIFMDIQMPVMNGIQATVVIRKQERQSQSARIPIIAIATQAQPGDRDKYQLCGMDNYIVVPAGVSELSELIETTISEFQIVK